MAALLALLSSLLWGSADFVGGTVSRRLPAVVVVAASQAAGLVTILVVAVLAGELDAPTGYLPWAVVSGLAGVTGLVCFYAALASGTMGVVSPIAALGVVIPVAAGLAGGDRPSGVQLAGIVVGVVGVILASGPELSGRAGLRPVVLALVAAVGFGVALWAIAKGSATSTLMTLVAMRATSVGLMAVLLPVLARRGTRVAIPLASLPVIVLIGIGDVAANLAFGLASTRGLVSVVAVLGSLYPVVTVLLARIVHGERLAAIQTVGVAGSLGGVAMIAAG